MERLVIFGLVFIIGLIIGSVVNICVDRIPAKTSIFKREFICKECKSSIKLYDMIPIISYLLLKGRCRKCRSKISVWYPIVELTNGLCYVLIFFVNGLNFVSVLFCLLTSALITLSLIDFKTYEIPFGINVFIFILGIIRLIYDYHNWSDYIIGLVAIFIPLMLLYYASNGAAIGGGDVKLMASCGLLIGWKLIIVSFFMGCILGSIIHVIRIKVSNEDHMLAMGPYLSLGVFITMLYGNRLIDWYLSLM